MAQDFQCLDQSNETISNMTDNVISSTLEFKYSENGQSCQENCKQVVLEFTYLILYFKLHYITFALLNNDTSQHAARP